MGECKCTNYTDLVDALLSLFCSIGVEIDRLDLNFIVGLLCRITFFFFIVVEIDFKSYNDLDYLSQIIVWGIQLLYIIFFESKYFFEGESKTRCRENGFKIMDIIQQTVGVIYLIHDDKSDLQLVALYFFLINLGLGFIELIKSFCQKTHIPNYNKKGGLWEFFVGTLLGSIVLDIVFSYYYYQYKDEIEDEQYTDSFQTALLGEYILTFLSVYQLCKGNLQSSEDRIKKVLGFLYGFTFGVTGIFYGNYFFIVAFIIYKCITCQSSKVYPL